MISRFDDGPMWSFLKPDMAGTAGVAALNRRCVIENWHISTRWREVVRGIFVQ